MSLVHWWSAAVLATLTLEASTAAAFCRTRTCDPSRDTCEVDQGCIVSGEPLSWPTTCTSFGVHKAGSALLGIGFEQANDLISASYQKWISASCIGGFPEIAVSPKGAIDCAKPEYNQNDGNANVWMFRDADWPYEGPNATLALTTITFNTQNGEIYDADVEINSHDNVITIGDERVVSDLESIVTHEIGHFFGLSHTRVEGATMRAEYTAGQTEIRTLSPDDVAGICDIYPPGRQGEQNDCVPRHGFSRKCASKDESTCSTAVAAPETLAAPSQHWFSIGIAGLALGLLIRRRRARRPA